MSLRICGVGSHFHLPSQWPKNVNHRFVILLSELIAEHFEAPIEIAFSHGNWNSRIEEKLLDRHTVLDLS